MPYQKDSARSGIIHSRIQGGEILAQRPHVAQGGPKGKISKLPNMSLTSGNGSSSYPFNHKV